MLELTEIPSPAPKMGEVLLKVGAVGLCHTDLHILDAPEDAFPVPLTLGHEISGRVAEVGSGVRDWRPGQAAAVFGLNFCGNCPACLAGRENQCRMRAIGGIGLTQDGGLADYVAVPAAQLMPAPEALDPTAVAPLTDAGLSPYHAIDAARPALGPGSSCLVIGIGGLGHMAIQILRATTAATVLGVDTSDQALRLAERVGAHHTFTAGPETARQIRDITEAAPGGVDVVIDCVGVNTTLELSRAVLAKGGYLLMVGLGGGQLALSPAPGSRSFPAEANIRQSFWGTRNDLRQVLALAERGHLSAEVHTFAFEDTSSAYDLLRQGAIQGRAAVVL
ncbi:NAD(P)-dependent alcohol dehydrogenase [Streptomyces chartreusis]|uniref:NAD(P)-dependent alcohol dehydrogenase n=1 Tax=Streptomyces chartreusis TaxID=1969 RepID=UPI00371913BC